MDRRAFFRCLPGAGVAAVAGAASIVTPKPRIEDVDGILVSREGGVVISNVVINNHSDKPALVFKQA